MLLRTIGLIFCLAISGWSCSGKNAVSCTQACNAGYVCGASGACQKLCNGTTDCPNNLCCHTGLCNACDSSDPIPNITSVTGSGSPDTTNGGFHLCDRLVVSGTNLSSTSFTLNWPSPSTTSVTLALATDVTNTNNHAELTLPASLPAGTYQLTAANESGSCSAAVPFLQGQQGLPGVDALAPAGAVIAFAGASAPAGWLICDGTAVSRTTYAALFAVVGVSHGGGDGATTFNLPDYRGRFLRGVDNPGTAAGAAGNDPDAATRTAPQPGNLCCGVGNAGGQVGSLQIDSIRSHTHGGVAVGDNYTGITNSCGSTCGGVVGLVMGNTAANAIPNGETRPANAYVNWIIKY